MAYRGRFGPPGNNQLHAKTRVSKIARGGQRPEFAGRGRKIPAKLYIVVHPRCKHVIDELTLYSYEIDPVTQEVLPRLKDKDNHVIDGLRYACEGVRRIMSGQKPRQAIPIPTRNYWK